MNVTVITPPATEPVTLAQVYDHLRLVPEGSPPVHPLDAAISDWITSAREEAEKITGRAFIEQTLLLVDDRVQNSIRLQRPPVIEIEEVSYYDTANVATVIDPAHYFVTEGFSPVLQFPYGYAYPCVYSRPDAFRVRYRAGFLDAAEPPAANVPSPIRHAILIGVEMLYRALTPQEHATRSAAWQALLNPYVVHALA